MNIVDDASSILFCLFVIVALGGYMYMIWDIKKLRQSILTDQQAIYGSRERVSYQYVDRLDSLSPDNFYRVAKVIGDHPKEFGKWVQEWDENSVWDDSGIDRKMVEEYLTMLEVSSQLLIAGAITPPVFWEIFEHYLRDIVDCQELYFYVTAKGIALWGLRTNLSSM